MNLGAGQSINARFTANRAAFETECAALQETHDIPSGVDGRLYAGAVWAWQVIRKSGGLGVFCHPFWRRGHGYALGLPLAQALLQSRQYDAIELISGYHPSEVESNMLQLAWYAEYLQTAAPVPVLATSDAHDLAPGNSESQFGCYYTKVLAKSLRFEDVAGAIREGRSVAAMRLPGAPLHLFGPHRMVRLFYFLAREGPAL